jgi:nitroreductase
MSHIIEALNWRYAVKTFDPTKKVNETDIHDLKEALRLAPSSYGLQPWGFVDVQDKGLRERIREISANQAQVTDASHLLVLCRLADITEDHIKAHIKSISVQRNVPEENLAGFQANMINTLLPKPKKDQEAWMDRQVYIALGFLMAAAAQKGIDTCPMEGFKPAECDTILGLDERGLKSVVLCPVGYRSDSDRFASVKKVRFAADKVFVTK